MKAPRNGTINRVGSNRHDEDEQGDKSKMWLTITVINEEAKEKRNEEDPE